MSAHSATNHDATLADIASNVGKCHRALEQLADTCCMAQRSAHMVKLTAEVQALDLLRDPGSGVEATDRAITQVGAVGGALGNLYATCCTPTREKLYISMFKSLGDIHTGYHKLKGVSH